MWWSEWMETELRERAIVTSLRLAWADLLRRYPWTHFVTLTVANEVNADVLERMVREYVERLEAMAGKRWWWAYAVEGGSSIRSHVHILMGGLPQSKAVEQRITQAWGRRGRVDVVDAADRPNAEGYLVKALALDYDHIDVAPGLPAKVGSWQQRRRQGTRSQRRTRPMGSHGAP